MLKQEQAVLDAVLSNLFGYHLLQVGRPNSQDLTRSSRITHRMELDLDPDTKVETPGGVERCIAEHHQLPMLSDSLDLVLLPHALELSAEPHQVLREVERTLIPEGHVVILGFNPLSLWGIRRLVTGWRGRVPWCCQCYTPTRVKDWLALLGFDTVAVRGYFFRPPFSHQGLMERLQFVERAGGRGSLMLAGGYALVAKKRVTTLTPIRPRWRPRRALVANGLAKPSVNNSR
ncbi:Methyltransferase domain-containing protein [Thiohalomonas denitrificans]|uniref:Methyltransferase domain-containing protein n=1 Tax=Thiohalomonas denitrificans TaxID=415747 RepID=A0A1G5QP80_9GAMM|nr:Methyltransferase domain-containing protein [Thiohalomonas denitrificans]